MKKPVDQANVTTTCTYTYDRQGAVVSIFADGIERLPDGLFTRPSAPLTDEQWAKRREEIRAEWIKAAARPGPGGGAPSSPEGT